MAFGWAAAPSLVRAQDNSAAVEALFAEGKKLEAQGDYAAACPKFLASYALEQRTGTLLNLAYCYEESGKLASAWARFVEARTVATRAGQAERADFAAQHAAALEPKLSKLVLTMAAGQGAVHATLDGTALDAAVFGVAMPVDAGDHVIQASAPGKEPWTGTVHVGADAATVAFEVPALVDVPAPPPPAVPAPTAAVTAPPPTDSTPAHERPPSMWTGRRVVGAAIAGAGVVAIGVGVGFFVDALEKKNAASSSGDCGTVAGVASCLPPGYRLYSDAINDANLATVFGGAGAALVVGGAVLWLTAPKPSTVAVSFDGRGVRISGEF
jgi:serine/threonine-protein kinase